MRENLTPGKFTWSWLAWLLARLLLVAFGAYFFVESFIFIRPHGVSPVFWIIFLSLFFMATTMVIRKRLPFFAQHTPFQRWLIAGAFAALVCFIQSLLFVIYVLQSNAPKLVRFAAPGQGTNEAWFVNEEDGPYGLYLFVKHEGQREQILADLGFLEVSSFHQAQWTKDGQMLVCSFIFKDSQLPPLNAMAYDFSTRHLYGVEFEQYFNFVGRNTYRFDETIRDIESLWQKHAAELQMLIDAHGGLSGLIMSNAMVKNDMQQIWFWQPPEDWFERFRIDF